MQDIQVQSSQVSERPQSACTLDLQEPSVKTHVQPTELVLKNPPTATLEPQELHFSDVMDKIVEHIGLSFMEPGSWLKFCDCMDLITGRVTELVETVNLSNLATMDWDKMPSYTVELLCFKYTPTLKLPKLQTTQALVSLGQYFTRSKLKPNKQRQDRRPQSASTNIQYNESTLLGDTNTKPKHKRTKTTLPADGPTASRGHAQTSITGTPAICLPLLEIKKESDETEVMPLPPPPPSKEQASMTGWKSKGTFTTQS